MPELIVVIQNADGVHRDDGKPYPSDQAAITQAGRAAGEVLADDVARGHESVEIKVMVERLDGSRVATIAVSAVVSHDGDAESGF